LALAELRAAGGGSNFTTTPTAASAPDGAISASPTAAAIDKFVRTVGRHRNALGSTPDYLYGIQSRKDALNATVLDIIDSVTLQPEKRRKYDELFFSALDFRSQAQKNYSQAIRLAQRGDLVSGKRFLDRGDRNSKVATLATQTSISVFESAVSDAELAVRAVERFAMLTCRTYTFATGQLVYYRVCNAMDSASAFVLDYYSDGLNKAIENQVLDIAIDLALDIPLPDLGGRSFSQALSQSVGGAIGNNLYTPLAGALRSDELAARLMKEIGRSGILLSEELVKERLRQMSDELLR
jgi:hypothetical protein